VRPGMQAADDHRPAARIGPVPGSVVYGHVEMPDSWCYRDCGGAEHRRKL
jgi:hypothetical protein